MRKPGQGGSGASRGSALARACLVTAALAGWAAPAAAQGLPEREFGEPWGGIPFGVRPIGMGGAYTAVADDLGGVMYNPAGLIQMHDTQIGVQTGSPYTARSYSPKDYGVDLVPYVGGYGFVTTAFRPWAAGITLSRNFHSESALPWQEEFYTGTFSMPLNSSRTGGMGINVKYLVASPFYESPLATDPKRQLNSSETGYAADFGMFYRIPMPLRDRLRQITFGLMARNIVGTRQSGNVSRTLPSQVLLGAAYTVDDLIPRERTVLAINLDQSLRSSNAPTSAQFRIGLDQSLFGDTVAVRVGYATPMPQYATIYATSAADPASTDPLALNQSSVLAFQGRPAWSAGLTINLLSFEFDTAITIPVEKRIYLYDPNIPENPYILTTDPAGNPFLLPVDKVRFYASVTYRFGTTSVAPFARVSVEPLVFAPKKGEVAAFNIDWRDERGIESWSLVIKNSARVPVRTFAAKGAPPARLVWDGLDDRFNLAPDDDCTYTLSVKNRDGIETVTPPQTLRIFTPGETPGQNVHDPEFLMNLNADQRKQEEAARAAVKPLLQGQLQEIKKPLGGGGASATPAADLPLPGDEAPPTGAPAPGALPVAPGGSATLLRAPAVGATLAGANLFELRGVAPSQIVRLQVPSGRGSDQVVLEYNSQQYLLKYVAREIRSLTEQTFANVGPTVGSFMVQARYGNHLLVVETPMAVARDLRAGRLDEGQWVKAARMTLDGRVIQPQLD